MARTGTATTARYAVVMAMLVRASASFADTPVPVTLVVVHVNDHQRLTTGGLSGAQRMASQVYAQIGVRLVWTDGHAVEAAADGALHLDVLILNASMTEQKAPAARALGEANDTAKHAYIHYSRIVMYANKHDSDPDLVLAVVLAHEIGHLLLHGDGHSPSGLMRANMNGRIVGVSAFTPAQAAIIRTHLADPR